MIILRWLNPASELAPSVAVAEIPSDTGRTVLIAPNSRSGRHHQHQDNGLAVSIDFIDGSVTSHQS